MLTSNSGATTHQALEEFHLLLRDCCFDQGLPRTLAVRYQICRTALMSGELKGRLPGFVRPCVSLLKFREFIHLYDHEPGPRLAFIDHVLEPCWAELRQAAPRAWEPQAPAAEATALPEPEVRAEPMVRPEPVHVRAIPLPYDEADDFMHDRDDDDSWG